MEPYSQELYVADFEDRAKGRALSGLDDTAVAFVQAAGAAIQVAEDDMFDLLSGLHVDDATGAILDRWGAVVGEPRLGLTDDVYRGFIKAKIRALFAASRRSEIVGVIDTVFDAFVTTYSNHVGHFRVNTESSDTKTDAFKRRALRLLEVMRPSGLDASLVNGPVGALRFSNATQGFGSPMGERVKS